MYLHACLDCKHGRLLDVACLAYKFLGMLRFKMILPFPDTCEDTATEEAQLVFRSTSRFFQFIQLQRWILVA